MLHNTDNFGLLNFLCLEKYSHIFCTRTALSNDQKDNACRICEKYTRKRQSVNFDGLNKECMHHRELSFYHTLNIIKWIRMPLSNYLMSTQVEL